LLAYLVIPAWDYYTMTPAQRMQRQLLALLEKPIDLPLPPGATLEDALKAIKKATQSASSASGILIYVDPIGLQEAEITMMSPVKVASQGVALKTWLRELLEPLKLGYTAQNGLLTVTSIEAVDEPLAAAPEAPH
jgi:hypothetical protein